MCPAWTVVLWSHVISRGVLNYLYVSICSTNDAAAAYGGVGGDDVGLWPRLRHSVSICSSARADGGGFTGGDWHVETGATDVTCGDSDSGGCLDTGSDRYLHAEAGSSRARTTACR